MNSNPKIRTAIVLIAAAIIPITFAFAQPASSTPLTAAQTLLQEIQSLTSPASTIQMGTTTTPQSLAGPIGISLPSLSFGGSIVPQSGIISQGSAEFAVR